MSKLTVQIGFCTSVFLSCLGTAYLVILSGIASSGTLVTMEPTSPAALWAGIDTLLAAFGLVILMACIAQYASTDKKVLGIVGLAFTILFAAVVSINRFTQLTIVRQSILIADTAGPDRFLPYGPRSVFFALEMLGWGCFLSLATFSTAPLFTGRAGYDGHKRKKGSKVHIAVDTLGYLLALHITPANEQERSQVQTLSEQVQEATGNSVEIAYVDQGYTGDNPEQAAKKSGIELVIVKLPEAKRGFVLLPRRWVVERSFAWTARFRRLARDFERTPETLAGLHFLAFLMLMLPKFIATIAHVL